MINRLTVIGFVLVLAGAVVPFLMVLGVLPSPLWLSFASYIGSVSGMFLGMVGLATGFRERRRRDGADR